MAIKLRSWATAATVGTSLAMPAYPADMAANDRILVLLFANGNVTFSEVTSTDFGSAESSSTSYSEDISIGVFEMKTAAGSETERTFQHSGGSIEFSMYVLVWSGVDTTAAIEAQTGDTFSNGTGTAIRSPSSVTTTGNNRVIIQAACVDANAVPVLDPSMMALTPGPFMNAASGNVGAATAVGWTVRAGSGTSAAPDVICAHRDTTVVVTIALKPADATDAPPYLASAPYDYFALMRSTANTGPFYGAGTFDAVADGVASINGNSTTADTVELINKQGLGGQSDSIGLNTASAEVGMRVGGWSIDSVDLSTNNVIICHPSASIAAPFDTQAKSGFALGLRSGTGNYRFFNLGGSNSMPNLREGWNAVMIDVTDSGNSIEDDGTFAAGSVDGVVVGSNKALSGTTTQVAVSDLATANRITIVGGSSADPAKVSSFRDGVAPFATFPTPSQTMQQVQIGDGSTKTYFYSPNTVLAPYDRAGTTSVNNQTDAGYSADCLVYASASDTIKLDDMVLDGDGTTPLAFHASTSASATYTWAGLKVIRRVVTLRDVFSAIGGATFSQCAEVVHNNADLSGGNTFDGCTGTQAITITGATQEALQAAIDLLANCTFSNSTTYGLTISFTGTGNVSLNAPSSLTVDELFYTSTNASALTIVVGSSGSSFANTQYGGSATGVTISNDKTLTVNISVTGAEVTLLERGTQTEIDHSETATTTYTYTYTYSSDTNADLQVYLPGYDAYWNDTVVLGDADQSISVTLNKVLGSQNG